MNFLLLTCGCSGSVPVIDACIFFFRTTDSDFASCCSWSEPACVSSVLPPHASLGRLHADIALTECHVYEKREQLLVLLLVCDAGTLFKIRLCGKVRR